MTKANPSILRSELTQVLSKDPDFASGLCRAADADEALRVLERIEERH